MTYDTMQHQALSASLNTAAVDFWLDINQGSLLSFYFLSRLEELSARFSADEIDEYTDEVDRLIASMGYAVSFDELSTAYEQAQQRLEFWAGHYSLLDAQGQAATLIIEGTQSSFIYQGEKLLDGRFEDGQLLMSSKRLSLSLRLRLVEAGEQSAMQAAQGFAVRCEGTLKWLENGGLERGEVNREIALRGKRGCYFADSIDAASDGDPLECWTGEYRLVVTAGQDWQWIDASLQVGSVDGKPLLQFEQQGFASIRYERNVLQAWTNAGHADGWVLRFFRTLDGDRRFEAARMTGGVMQPLTGYACSAAEAPRAKNRMMADAPTEPLSFTLNWDTPDDLYELPQGNEGNPYELNLTIASKSSGDSSASYSWEISVRDENYPNVLAVSTNSDKKSAKLVGAFGQTEHAGHLYFTIRITSSTKEQKEFHLKLTVLSLLPLSISSTSLPPITRNRPYQIALQAGGGNPPYLWDVSIPKELLDEGMKFDKQKVELRGTIESDSLSGSLFDVVVTVRSSNVMMLPAREVLHLKLEEPPIVGGNVSNWFEFAFGIVTTLGGLLLLGQWVYAKAKRLWQGEKVDPAKEISAELKNLREHFSNAATYPTQHQISEMIHLELQREQQVCDQYDRRIELAKERSRRSTENWRQTHGQWEALFNKEQKSQHDIDELKTLEERLTDLDNTRADAEKLEKRYANEKEMYKERTIEHLRKL